MKFKKKSYEHYLNMFYWDILIQVPGFNTFAIFFFQWLNSYLIRQFYVEERALH